METIRSSSKASPSDNDRLTPLADAVRHLLALDDERSRRQWIERCLSLSSVDELFPHLKIVSEQHLTIDPYAALRIAEAMVTAGGMIGRPEYRALGLIAKGDAFRVLGRYQESVIVLNEGAEIFLASGDEYGWARTRIGWVWSFHNLGHGAEAFSDVDRAREIFVRHQDWLRAATLDNNAGWVCYELGKHEEALDRYDRALGLYAMLGADTEVQATWTKNNKARLLTELGDFQTALRLHEETREVYLRHGNTVSLFLNERNIAFVYAAQGHFTRALHHNSAARAAQERAKLDLDASGVALDMIECHLSLNRIVEALELAEETVDRFECLGALTEAALARFYCAIAHARLGDIAQALSLLDTAGRVFDTAGLSARLALVTLQRATLHLDDENWFAAYEQAERASMLFAEHGLVIRRAQADLIRARAAFALGDGGTAADVAQAVLAVSRDKDVLWLAHEAHHILGDVAQVRGDLPGALDAYANAIAGIERMQSSLAIDLRANFLADKLRVFEDAITVSLDLSQVETAFIYLERAKSRALVDYLASNMDIQMRTREGGDQEVLERLARLREEHNGLYNRLYGFSFRQPDETKPAPVDDETLRAAIRDREKRIARVLERLALDRTEGLVTSAPDAQAYQAMPDLGTETVLLEYFFRGNAGAVFVVSSGGLTVVPLSVGPREVGRLLHQWHLNLATTTQAISANTSLEGLARNARGILASLYRALIGPVAMRIAGHERVIIVPYGPLHTVPFHALFDGAHYLLETVEISVCPSSSLLKLCAEHSLHTEPSALVVAHTDGGRLPAVLEEARIVGALLPGECYIEHEATRSAVITAASRHNVLHLAAHGEARLDNPTFAHLKLADGQLSIIDVFNLHLQGALITLSACETGRSAVVGGDELIGLSRGFLYAGAATLVQSLWRVEDHSTAALMEHFYRGIRDGQAKGAALRDAQRAMLATHGAHPYYWAPFQLVGDRGHL